jgi:carbon storage regulator
LEAVEAANVDAAGADDAAADELRRLVSPTPPDSSGAPHPDR